MHHQSNEVWVLPAGQVRFCRSHWVQTNTSVYDNEILQGVIELENFDRGVRRWSVHILQENHEQFIVLNEIPTNQAYWIVSDWTDEREFDSNGVEISHIRRQPLFDLNIRLE